MKLLLSLAVYVIIIGNVYCAKPTITGVPTSVNMGEREYKRRPIFTIQVTDVNNDFFTCNIFSVTPTPSNKNVSFNILIDSSYGSYVVYAENADPGTDANPNQMFEVSLETSFQLVFKCNDSQNHASYGRLEVDIIDNDRITLTNLPDAISLDASTTKANTIVYSTSATLLSTGNDDGLTYTMRTPSSSSFAIDGFGNIRATQDLNRENNSPIIAFITVSDGNMWIEQILKITLTKMNDIPEITNMLTPQEVYLSESLASGTTIISLTGNDADADPLTYAINVDPVTDIFELDTSTSPPVVRLKAGKSLDYETATYYNLTATVTDNKATGGPYVLNIHVQNVNEPCTFDRSLYTLTTNEGPAGSILGNPGFVVTDGDGVNQAYSLSLTNINNGNRTDRLVMNATSGLISYATEYNIDNAAMISTLYAGVKCTDSAGNTGTTTLVIYIQDINDNAPGCTNEYTYYTNQFTVIGAALGTPAVTDIDSGDNGQFNCVYGTTQNLATTTNNYVVGTDCLVSFNSRDGLTDGMRIRFTLLATDKGTPLSKTGTCFVNVIYNIIATTTTPATTTTTTTPTTTTTTAAPSTGLSDGSLAAIIIGALVGAALLGILLYMLFRWCFTGFCCGPDPCDFAGCCRRGNYSNNPRRQITPVRERQAIRDKAYDRPRNTADEFNYYRDDSHLGSIKDYGNSRHSRPDRLYPDWPQTGEAQFPRLSPSDARLEMMSGPYSKPPLAIRY